MNPVRSIVVVFLFLMNTSVWAAENAGGAWTDPEVLKATLAIGMTDEQKPKFGRKFTMRSIPPVF